jgi:hypothetical protein
MGAGCMSNTLKKLKKAKRKAARTSPLLTAIMEAWNRGFDAGAKQQNEADRKYLVQLLLRLEEEPGIGKKTADKVREFFKREFGK